MGTKCMFNKVTPEQLFRLAQFINEQPEPSSKKEPGKSGDPTLEFQYELIKRETLNWKVYIGDNDTAPIVGVKAESYTDDVYHQVWFKVQVFILDEFGLFSEDANGCESGMPVYEYRTPRAYLDKVNDILERYPTT